MKWLEFARRVAQIRVVVEGAALGDLELHRRRTEQEHLGATADVEAARQAWSARRAQANFSVAQDLHRRALDAYLVDHEQGKARDAHFALERYRSAQSELRCSLHKRDLLDDFAKQQQAREDQVRNRRIQLEADEIWLRSLKGRPNEG